MRLWYISPAYLDNQRLRAAHQENHALLTCVRKGRQWGLVTERHKMDMAYPKMVHDVTVLEMYIRQGKIACAENQLPESLLKSSEEWLKQHYQNSKTAYLINSLGPQCFQTQFIPIRELLIQDCKDLRQKWTLEHYYFGCGRIPLTHLESSLGLPLGTTLTPSQLANLQIESRTWVKENKDWFNQYREKHPKSRMQDRIQAFLKNKGELSCVTS
jgi:hypothetical protein